MGDDDVPTMPGSDYTIFEAMQGSSAFGKPSEADQEETQDAILDALGMSRELWNTTKGMRRNVNQLLQDFTAGDFDYGTDPRFASHKSAIEDQYKSSKDDVIASVADGGSLDSAIGTLANQRARSFTDVISDIQQDMFQKAYGAGYGVPGQAISGMNQGAQNLQQMLAMQYANAGDNAAGIGSLIGAIIGS